MLLQFISANLFISVVGARICSSIFNYTMNRKFVFADGNGASIRKSLPRYFTLVIIIVLFNYGLMHVFHERLDIPLIAAKLFTEGSLFVFSYWAQRKFVYDED
ncbi:GtrA family protein [Paenibacillus mendelii]|uniref:GtrA family protein n=1 Tax=Paenibacillus mendelii TaxID=206163 RepID=A0ABV6JPA2_9BACL|nr:GtrA family protein [Paenibacillus mendelii]MCQ6562348.1 GtrA family protein [Paenibacillus mendelii]